MQDEASVDALAPASVELAGEKLLASFFVVLEREVIPTLFQGKTGEDQVRVWVAGCASGEEAYSLSMLLLEYAQSLERPNDYLFLGFAETIEDAQRFREVNQRACIFQRQPCPEGAPPLLTVSVLPILAEAQPAEQSSLPSYAALHTRLLEQYAPPSLLVDADYTPPATALFNLILPDQGRQLAHLCSNPRYAQLAKRSN